MTYDYFYGQQAEMFAFYRVPKVLFTEDCFWNVSTDAKLLYGILLDRMNLSARNGWLDEEGRVYIIFTIEEIKGALGCAEKKAVKLLDELEIQTDNIDLLEQIETALANGDDAPDGLMRVFQRVTSIAGRIDSAKKLAEAMKVLVGMEREAYGIVEAAKVEHTGKDGGPVEVVHMTPEAIREVMEKDDC